MGNKTIRHVNTYESYHFRNATDASANSSEDEVQMTMPQLEAAVRGSRTSPTAKVQSSPPLSASLVAPRAPITLHRTVSQEKSSRKKGYMQDLEYNTSKFKRSDHLFSPA